MERFHALRNLPVQCPAVLHTNTNPRCVLARWNDHLSRAVYIVLEQTTAYRSLQKPHPAIIEQIEYICPFLPVLQLQSGKVFFFLSRPPHQFGCHGINREPKTIVGTPLDPILVENDWFTLFCFRFGESPLDSWDVCNSYLHILPVRGSADLAVNASGLFSAVWIVAGFK